ncbi:elongation factor 4 [Candidatus Daviesbacteria bacterium RIFCSPLOWO2_01_FULL_38_10]|uniref:Elongation factor 4 n=1 Tax=Candidatus Daviesbacteria bacterium GW2011_GWF2_38_6 TaxID=1618432 RepID=A0A0G0KDL2_9BACT|nr:MAG: Elongation factor 4 [Candidatus Daviesbacteria bacterium GW2011_GWF2_38_6]OGE38010.1 MAG: elongation factor 4 [Candidatus Daviesbacteria bacterium RIFCSPLOWO2_01_FULL_38_10]OGE67188.1 MAG: elongation factor 4 [Candidatus Daviesbacteria bacterium RIFCSPLOWO2_02_FULL_38_18]OGE73524.1 MAG: elongation factor 4 [Candidatus Daviesbacteria bacterium RIFCSPLOWO2_12_FULL_38_10]HCB22971.1 elongation factor 4 [Candidatus Daviesbacteria bacterium]
MKIRNFCIIAHVDHGKSTLADRFLEICHTIPADKMKPQLLDSLALERERGITIKLAPVRLNYTLHFELYTLNLIDTPGHVDFSYEVSRSLAAVEGAILLVDATVGIQAQTLAHGLAAMEQNLTLIPVINKIDLPNADIENTKKQLVETFGFNGQEILLVSAKSGEGVEDLLKVIIEKIPPPKEDNSFLRALVFDSFYDPFKGVVAEVRIVSGQTPSINTPIYFLQTKARGHILETGFFAPQLTPTNILSSGEIGYIATGIKIPDLVRVGDTISTELDVSPLQGYREVKPMVFVGLYPIDQDEYQDIKDSLHKFRLNDPSFIFELEHSQALGSGFRCGFLGLLHAEVVQERLSEEYGVDLLATIPSVEYMIDGKIIDNPAEFDASAKIIQEPWVNLKIFAPQQFLGNVMELLQDKRGKFKNMQHFGSQVEFLYEMPLAEMITDFYDKLKSVSSGFASLDWQFLEFREVDAVKVDILVGGEKVDALSQIVFKEKAEFIGRRMVEKLKEVLPRQNFEVAIQALIGGTIIARETLGAFRKDVTAKLYGGDRTRKDKLLEKQKKGKKKMKMIGRVEIPQEAFLSILKS